MEPEDFEAFLVNLRAEPSPRFLARLKAKLDRQADVRRKALPDLRVLFFGMLIGGAAFALTSLWLERPRHGGEAVHTEQSRQPPTRTVAPPMESLPRPDIAVPHAPTAAKDERTPRPVAPVAPVSVAKPPSPSPGIVASHALQPYLDPLTGRLGQVLNTTSAAAQARLCTAGSEPFTAPPLLLATDRRMKASELEACPRQRYVRMREVILGYEVAILARSTLYGPMRLTARDVFLALASRVPPRVQGPVQPGVLVPNTYGLWSEIDSQLPADPIRVVGPLRGTYPGKALLEVLMGAGCDSYAWIAGLRETDEKAHEDICHGVRFDGTYVERPDYLGAALISELETNPTFLGVFTPGRLAVSQNELAVSPINGVEPTYSTYASGDYPAARTLYFYTALQAASLTSYLQDVNRGMFSEPLGLLVPARLEQRQLQDPIIR
jgi:phosphate transport system substrate-binding protein